MLNYFLSMPDQLEMKIDEWKSLAPDIVRIDSLDSYSGDTVYAISLSQFSNNDKPAHYFAQPHAHEPAATAGMINVIEQMVTGKDLFGNASSLDVEHVLQNCVLTFNPIGNAQGRSKAPVTYWDGTQYTNDQLWCWMRGEDPENPGHMWERFNIWDDRKLNAPNPVGIVYEQIDEHRWVEPNRTQLSTYFKLFFKMDAQYHYLSWLDLHQTEYVDSEFNCEILIGVEGSQSDLTHEHNVDWGQSIVDAWTAAGYTPYPQPHAVPYTGEQANYFKQTWGELRKRIHIISTEVKNNAQDLSPERQLRAQSLAIEKSIEIFLSQIKG